MIICEIFFDLKKLFLVRVNKNGLCFHQEVYKVLLSLFVMLIAIDGHCLDLLIHQIAK